MCTSIISSCIFFLFSLFVPPCCSNMPSLLVQVVLWRRRAVGLYLSDYMPKPRSTVAVVQRGDNKNVCRCSLVSRLRMVRGTTFLRGKPKHTYKHKYAVQHFYYLYNYSYGLITNRNYYVQHRYEHVAWSWCRLPTMRTWYPDDVMRKLWPRS